MANFNYSHLMELLESDQKEAVKYYRKFAKIANARIKRLNESGKSSRAFDMATYYNQETRGKIYFSEGAKDIEDNAIVLKKFLGSKSSSLSGLARATQKALDTLQERGFIDIPKKGRKAFEKRLKELFESSRFDELKKAYGSGVISAAADAFATRLDTEELILAMNEEDSDIFEIWEGWYDA